MAHTLQHPERGTVVVDSEARRDVLLGRGFTLVEDEKPAEKKPAAKAPVKKSGSTDTE